MEKQTDKICGKFKKTMPSKTVKILYNSLVLPHCDYVDVV